MLFEKRSQKFVKAAWIGLSVLIIVSMVLLYFPVF
jgi:predicted nucleic acid-binding Zn ribbon protein